MILFEIAQVAVDVAPLCKLPALERAGVPRWRSDGLRVAADANGGTDVRLRDARIGCAGRQARIGERVIGRLGRTSQQRHREGYKENTHAGELSRCGALFLSSSSSGAHFAPMHAANS